jgi:hypothetical protein
MRTTFLGSGGGFFRKRSSFFFLLASTILRFLILVALRARSNVALVCKAAEEATSQGAAVVAQGCGSAVLGKELANAEEAPMVSWRCMALDSAEASSMAFACEYGPTVIAVLAAAEPRQ